jgi:single-strand DNA-binding protein
MASLNKVFIMGRLGQDPELRHTQGQVAVATLNIATTEVWMKEGQKQEQTEWHRVVVWGRQAENCAKYLAKGRPVFVEGRLQTRTWEDKNGQKRQTTEINASNVQFMPGGGPASAGASTGAYMPPAEAGGGFGGGYGASNYGAGGNGGMPAGYSDIPSAGPGVGGGYSDGLDDIPF